MTQSILSIGVYFSLDAKHPSPYGRKLRIHAPGVGTIWVHDCPDRLDEARAWLARVYTRPVESLNVYELREVDDIPAGPVD